MAEIRVYIQPRLPAASGQTAFYDFSKHVQFDSLEWEQNDQGNASTMRANIYSIMPVSTTNWASYAGATEAAQIQNALDDSFYHLDIPSRTEIQIRDVSTSPHTILWGGVVTRVSENRDGGAIVGSIDAVDYTALLNEAVALEFTPLANSTIKQTITSGTYTFTPSFAQRTAGLAAITVSSISVGAPYSRNLEIGDTIVVNISDDTYDGVHKITGIASEGSTYKLRFQQYSNVADSASAAVTGTVIVPGFMTTANAPQLNSRISTVAGNIADLNPDYRFSPRNPDITRAISNVARTTTTATITTSAPHGFGQDRVVTIALTNGPSGFADLNGSFVIASVPTDSTFTYTTITSGTITSGAATGTAACAGEITPTPLKGGTLSTNLSYAVKPGNGVFYLGAGTLDGGGNLTIPLNVKSKELSDLITNGLFDANKTVNVSKIISSASTTKTVTTSYPHGLYTGYSVTVSGATGTNAADVNGNTYTITVTSSTTFTFTAATSNALNLTGGSIAITAASGWSVGSFSIDTTGTTGPYGVGNSAYYVGADHHDVELASTNRIAVTAGERYFFSWREKAEHYDKAHLHVKFYNAGGTVVGNSHGYDICKVDSPNNEWSRNYGLIEVPATATQMTPVLHHDSFSSSHSVYYTDIQAIKLTGAFGFSDRVAEDETYYNDLTSGSIDLRDFENPSAPEESGEASNRIYVYAPYTVQDPLTGARQVTSYRNTYDFVQGVWSAGGKIIESSIVNLSATDSTTAMLTAQQHFRNTGISLRSFEFEHISGPLNVGDVIPFIWNELGIAEALVVRRQVGYLIGQEVFYRVQLGGDMSFQRSTMYLVERRLKEITGDAAYFSPPPSPYPGYPTEGGIVTPASPSGDAGSEKIDISWEYPQSVLSGASFGGFVVLRSGDAGDNWVKASTGEAILTAQNPLAPDTAVPSFTDTTVAASTGYIYKVAAVDVSGAAPVLTEYSAETTTLTPTAPGGADFTDAYDGLGLNIPKIVDSVDHWNGYAKNIATLASGASTTATVTITGGHGMTTGSGEVYVVHIKGVTGANSGDVPDGYYAATYASSTTFTITKTGTNSLSLSGGIATIYRVGGGFVVDTVAYTLTGTPGSVETQYPLGQLVYAENDGKLYRNGKVGTNLFDYYWTRAAVDAIDVSADGQVSISADRLTAGTIDAGIINVTDLNASNITAGTLTSIAINAGSGTFQVTSGGALTASSATITGSVTATSGTIAGWTATTVGDDRLHAGSGSNFVGLSTGSTAIFAGATSSTGTSAKFSVTSAGAVGASDITITGGSITGTSINVPNAGAPLFSVASDGATTISSLSVTSSDGTKPGVLISKPSDRGDISVPTGQALSLGHWSGSAFSEKFRIPSSGGVSIYNSTGSSVVASISNTGRATMDIQDGINFYDGTTNRGRLRASTATTRLVFDQALNVDGLLTVSTGGIDVTGASSIDGNLNVTNGSISASSNISSGAIIQTTGSTNHFQYTEVPAATTTANPNTATGVMFTELVSGVYRFRRSSTASYAAVKKNIEPAENYLTPQQFSALNFIKYQYDSEKLIEQFPIYDEVSEQVQYGLAIEQLKDTMPSAIMPPNAPNYPETIDWQQIYISAMISLQDAVERIGALETRIAELEA